MEKGIRIGCGATFGALVGFLAAFFWLGRAGIFSLFFAGLFAGLFGGIFAFLAERDGDAFWSSFFRDRWWWPF
jgi:hypothetical protein